jgi:hypothetical protein
VNHIYWYQLEDEQYHLKQFYSSKIKMQKKRIEG